MSGERLTAAGPGCVDHTRHGERSGLRSNCASTPVRARQPVADAVIVDKAGKRSDAG